MKELLKSVEALTAEELARSYEKFPKFNSPHEGYAVIKEEVEEHADDTSNINLHMNFLWSDVRLNRSAAQLLDIKNIKELAIHAAAEAIQVAAMVQKYIDSLGGAEYA